MNDLANLYGSASATNEDGANVAANAIDNNGGTHWGSNTAAPLDFKIDLGRVFNINEIRLLWDAVGDYPRVYTVDYSLDDIVYNTAVTEGSGVGGQENYVFPTVKARYISIDMTDTATNWVILYTCGLFGQQPHSKNIIT